MSYDALCYPAACCSAVPGGGRTEAKRFVIEVQASDPLCGLAVLGLISKVLADRVQRLDLFPSLAP
jgi:hypothetical protein